MIRIASDIDKCILDGKTLKALTLILKKQLLM